MSYAMMVGGLLLAMAAPACALYRAKNEIKEEQGSYAETLKIKVEHPGNPDYLYISLNAVVHKDMDGVYLHDTGSPDERYAPVFHDLIKISGVTSVGPSGLGKSYKITLQKGDVFTFEDDIIEPAIEIIKKHFGKGKNIEILPTVDNRNRKYDLDDDLDY